MMMIKNLLCGLLLGVGHLLAPHAVLATDSSLPDTGISGVYEVMVGTHSARPLIDYFAEFGFRVVADKRLSRQGAKQTYGVDSGLHAYRLQNGDIDSHGLLRILEWEQLAGPGVGYAPPETIGQRMAVMRTRDIVRIYDVFSDLRIRAGQAWLPTEPVFDDLYNMDEGAVSIRQRRVGVREMAAYGQLFNHVFFQRYGYQIPGYGSVGEHSPLQTSEFTHHDFIVSGDMAEISAYYSTVLGLRAENDPVIDGDWQAGPREVFMMAPGESHWYRGFVSPNNICGKIKLFSAIDPAYVRDRSDRQRIGQAGITLHSYFTPRLKMVHTLAREHGLESSHINKNEFGEESFLLTGPDGVRWQIISKRKTRNRPVTRLDLQRVNN